MSQEITYFQQRLQTLGITDPEQYTIHNYTYGAYKRGQEGFHDRALQIFQEDDDGNIRIHYPSLEGLKYQWKRKDEKSSKDYFVTRLKDPKGDMKYEIKKGSGSFPFLPPGLIKKYQEGTHIDTLILTEGAFKAFKGDMCGFDIAGLTSITHAKDRVEIGLHLDLQEIIKRCKVNRVIWLADGDCNRISSKPIEEIKDLITRPRQFFYSAKSIQEYLKAIPVLDKVFAHILTDELDDLNNPKGLDDLLCAAPDKFEEILKDLLLPLKEGPTRYFYHIDMSSNTGKVWKYFHLNSVESFYLYHVDKRKDLGQARQFVWNGSTYQWNHEKDLAEQIIPGDAKDYFRVGDTYFEHVLVPNKHGGLNQEYQRRLKTTIADDHLKKSKNFFDHIPKYKSFCNKPDHIHYEQIIENCYNMYGPFEHPSEEGECEKTLEFLRHIFGTNTIKWKHPRTKIEMEINELDLGLDYLQLLYQKPTQILPILCLVSAENGTGKSTLAKFLKLLFTSNVAIVGNADLSNDFNAFWASKLLVICDEAKIDKQVVVEKIKALSTADKIMMNRKGVDQVEIDMFAKFILISNYEDNFIYANREDVRYWIRKIPKLETQDVSLLDAMNDEIPAFIAFLDKRRIVTENLYRAWFDPKLIYTAALEKVIHNSRSTVEKEITLQMEELFLATGEETIEMAPLDVSELFFRGKYDRSYITRIMKNDLRLELKVDPENSDTKLFRYRYPVNSAAPDPLNEDKLIIEWKSKVGRPYVFKRDRFTTSHPDQAMMDKNDPELNKPELPF